MYHLHGGVVAVIASQCNSERGRMWKRKMVEKVGNKGKSSMRRRDEQMSLGI